MYLPEGHQCMKSSTAHVIRILIRLYTIGEATYLGKEGQACSSERL